MQSAAPASRPRAGSAVPSRETIEAARAAAVAVAATAARATARVRPPVLYSATASTLAAGRPRPGAPSPPSRPSAIPPAADRHAPLSVDPKKLHENAQASWPLGLLPRRVALFPVRRPPAPAPEEARPRDAGPADATSVPVLITAFEHPAAADQPDTASEQLLVTADLPSFVPTDDSSQETETDSETVYVLPPLTPPKGPDHWTRRPVSRPSQPAPTPPAASEVPQLPSLFALSERPCRKKWSPEYTEPYMRVLSALQTRAAKINAALQSEKGHVPEIPNELTNSLANEKIAKYQKAKDAAAQAVQQLNAARLAHCETVKAMRSAWEVVAARQADVREREQLASTLHAEAMEEMAVSIRNLTESVTVNKRKLQEIFDANERAEEAAREAARKKRQEILETL